MPISSGAEGHVGVGVNRSIKWVPEGGEDYQAARISNSYLQRYLNQYGPQEKIKNEELITKSVSPRRIYNTQNRVNTIEESDMSLTERSRNKPITVQDGLNKEANSTVYSPEKSRKTGNEDLHTDANNAHMTSKHQPIRKVMASSNGPAKKSRVCAIL